MGNSTLPDLDLRLFDGAAAGAEGEHSPDPGGKTNTGKTNAGGEAKGEGTPPADPLKARRETYRALMEGEYKDLYTEDTKRILDRRMQELNALQARLNAHQPILDLLARRYQVEGGDLDKLQQAIQADRAAGAQRGMPAEEDRATQKAERERGQLRQRRQGEARMARQLDRWYRESQQVKARYPDFDLKTEVQDRAFLGLLRAGIPVQQAYELQHIEEIKAAAARAAAQAVGQQMTARIRARAARPSENGIASQSAVLVKNDVSKLTRAQRADIARRVAQGEEIFF